MQATQAIQNEEVTYNNYHVKQGKRKYNDEKTRIRCVQLKKQDLK